MLNAIKGLKGENRFETLENYSMAGVVFGALVFSAGIGLTVITPKGIPAIMTMLGAVVSLLSSVSIVLMMLIKDLIEKEKVIVESD